jgi:hypothetical protein
MACLFLFFCTVPTMFTRMRTAHPGLVDICPGEDRSSALGREVNFREVYA